VHLFSGIAVAAVFVLAGCAGPEAHSGEAGAEVSATAGPESGDLLLHGELMRGGEPVADGQVWVSVLADPAEAEAGDVIPTWESTVTSSDDDGRFAVSVDRGVLSSDFFNGEYLNYDINVLQDGDWATWSTTAHLVGKRVWRSDEYAALGDPVAEVTVDLGVPTITLTDSDGSSETSELPVVPGAGDAVLPLTG
jgi:hypothetical protein